MGSLEVKEKVLRWDVVIGGEEERVPLEDVIAWEVLRKGGRDTL